MNLPLHASYIRCLAHTSHKNEWCPRRETCARNITIRHDKLDGSLHVKARLCVSNDFESFVDINEAEPEAHCTYPHCNCPFDAPADPNWCARAKANSGAPSCLVAYGENNVRALDENSDIGMVIKLWNNQ